MIDFEQFLGQNIWHSIQKKNQRVYLLMFVFIFRSFRGDFRDCFFFLNIGHGPAGTHVGEKNHKKLR